MDFILSYAVVPLALFVLLLELPLYGWLYRDAQARGLRAIPILFVAHLVGIYVVSILAAVGAYLWLRPRKREEIEGSIWSCSFEAVAVVVVLMLILKCFVVDSYHMSNSSMEPRIAGDVALAHSLEQCLFPACHLRGDGSVRSRGDTILAVKTLSPMERFDLVAFRFPLDISKMYIQRVVGLPDEEIVISRGEIWHRRNGESKFRLARKPANLQETLWVDVNELTNEENFNREWRAKPEEGEPEHGPFEVNNGLLRTLEKNGHRSVLFEYAKPLLDVDQEDGRLLNDMRIAFEVDATGTEGSVKACVEGGNGNFEMRMGPSQPGYLSITHPGGAKEEIPLKVTRLEPDMWHRVELSVCDGVVTARFDGDVVAEREILTYLEEAPALHPRSGVQFGCRGLLANFRNLKVQRDIYYRTPRTDANIIEGVPLRVAPNCYVTLGDNPQTSLDSRSWRRVDLAFKNGRHVIAEQTEMCRQPSILAKHKRPDGQQPEWVVQRDQAGNAVAIFAGELANPVADIQAFPFVHSDYIIGKVWWTLWPPGRWFRRLR